MPLAFKQLGLQTYIIRSGLLSFFSDSVDNVYFWKTFKMLFFKRHCYNVRDFVSSKDIDIKLLLSSLADTFSLEYIKWNLEAFKKKMEIKLKWKTLRLFYRNQAGNKEWERGALSDMTQWSDLKDAHIPVTQMLSEVSLAPEDTLQLSCNKIAHVP